MCRKREKYSYLFSSEADPTSQAPHSTFVYIRAGWRARETRRDTPGRRVDRKKKNNITKRDTRRKAARFPLTSSNSQTPFVPCTTISSQPLTLSLPSPACLCLCPFPSFLGSAGHYLSRGNFVAPRSSSSAPASRRHLRASALSAIQCLSNSNIFLLCEFSSEPMCQWQFYV